MHLHSRHGRPGACSSAAASIARWRPAAAARPQQQPARRRQACAAAPVDEAGQQQPQPQPPQPPQQVDDAAAEVVARSGWDPHGLFKNASATANHIERRARQRQQQGSSSESSSSSSTAAAATAVQAPPASASSPQQQQQQQPQQQQAPPSPAPAAAPPVFVPSDPIERIPARWLAQGGIPAADAAAYDRRAFTAKLAQKFMPLDLDFPGVRIVNFDPAILTIERFMSREECEEWQRCAEDSGCLQQSKIGAGNAAAAAGGGSSSNVYGSRRTSSSLLLDPPTQAKAPGLQALMQAMHSRGHQLMAHLDGARSWGPPGRMPAGGQYCYESPQVARYLEGQHFLSHEDAFPALLAAANGFQRHATLLLYLNDVPQGGATYFDHLGLAVQPQQGMALLFFPSYSDGRADARTLHTAQDACDTKWVMQQWIARGHPVPKAVLKAVKVAAMAGPEAVAPPTEPVREVFRVVASSAGASSGGGGGTKSSSSGRKKQARGGKKGGGGGFSRR